MLQNRRGLSKTPQVDPPPPRPFLPVYLDWTSVNSFRPVCAAVYNARLNDMFRQLRSNSCIDNICISFHSAPTYVRERGAFPSPRPVIILRVSRSQECLRVAGMLLSPAWLQFGDLRDRMPPQIPTSLGNLGFPASAQRL